MKFTPDAGDLPPPEVGATGAGPKRGNSLGSAFAGFSRVLHRGPSLSPTVHRPALRGASRWFLPRSACPNNSAWVRMVTGRRARPPLTSTGAELLLMLVLRMLVLLLLMLLLMPVRFSLLHVVLGPVRVLLTYVRTYLLTYCH